MMASAIASAEGMNSSVRGSPRFLGAQIDSRSDAFGRSAPRGSAGGRPVFSGVLWGFVSMHWISVETHADLTCERPPGQPAAASRKRPRQRSSPKAGTLRLRGKGVAEATLLYGILAALEGARKYNCEHIYKRSMRLQTVLMQRRSVGPHYPMPYLSSPVITGPSPETSGATPMRTITRASAPTIAVPSRECGAGAPSAGSSSSLGAASSMYAERIAEP
jgi:hypothetical protein